VVEVDFPLMHNYDVDRPGTMSVVARGLVPQGWGPRPYGAPPEPNTEFDRLNPYSWERFLADNHDPKLTSWTQVDPMQVFPNPPGSVDARRMGPARDYSPVKPLIAAGVPPFESLPGFAEALRGWEQVRKVDFEQWLDANALDFIAFPANADVGQAKADVDDAAYDHATSNGVARSNTNAMLRHVGIPSVSVSMGLMGDTGMPVNVTFAGKAYSDNALLSYAWAYGERHAQPPPARAHRRARRRVIEYDPARTTAPALRRDKLPPRVSIAPRARLAGGAMLLSGAASDAGGLGWCASMSTGTRWPMARRARGLPARRWRRSRNGPIRRQGGDGDRAGRGQAGQCRRQHGAGGDPRGLRCGGRAGPTSAQNRAGRAAGAGRSRPARPAFALYGAQHRLDRQVVGLGAKGSSNWSPSASRPKNV
jgi:amidase